MSATTPAFDARRYGSAVAELLERARLMELGPGKPTAQLTWVRGRIDLDKLFAGAPVVDQDMGRCCQAGLLLYHDFLDESHHISQEIETTTGSYWHGIMHRREPDYSNAKYWFRRVGRHPVLERLSDATSFVTQGKDQSRSRELATLSDQETWDPFKFVDACQAAARSGGEAEELCRGIQICEWQLLFDYCYARAVGNTEK